MRLSFPYVISAFMLFASSAAQCQIITTIAGDGTSGYGLDGIPATATQLRGGRSIATDTSGNVYIDDGSYRIRKVDAAGTITTIAGNTVPTYGGDGGPATLASFDGSKGITVDGHGNLYISESASRRIRRVNATAVISTYAGNGVFGITGDGGPATDARLAVITGIATDDDENVYIVDDTRIRKISAASGIITTFAGRMSSGFSGDGGPATAAEISRPGDVVFDQYGNLYISDGANYRVRKVDTDGIITTVAGSGLGAYSGDGGPATAAGLMPAGLATDKCGNLYVTDPHRIRKVNSAGIIKTVAGTGTFGFSGDGGPATAAMLQQPSGIDIDSKGRLLIADAGNNRIRRVTFTNTAPAFTSHTLTVTACQNAETSLNTLLTITEADEDQTVTWSLLDGPTNGTAAVSHSMTAVGTIVPTGLYYRPTAGYTGPDSFKVRIRDCAGAADTAMVYVTVTPLPDAGSISGPDSVCTGGTITLLAATGGTWSTATARAGISSTGIVTGITAGTDTIRYIATNTCGTDTATHAIVVTSCITNVNTLTNHNSTLTISPNPAPGGTFTVSLTAPTDEAATIVITDITGRRLHEVNAMTNRAATVQLGLPAGLYFVTATAAQGRWCGKVVVE